MGVRRSRRRGRKRRGHQELHRPARRRRPAGRGVAGRPSVEGSATNASRRAATRGSAALAAWSRGADRLRPFIRREPRSRLGGGDGGRAQVQGGLRHSGRSVLGSGAAPRADGAGLVALAEDMRRRGARVLLAAPPEAAPDLPLATSDAEDLDPIVAIQSFYPMVEALARASGRDPDAPPHLAKITVTR